MHKIICNYKDSSGLDCNAEIDVVPNIMNAMRKVIAKQIHITTV